MQQLRRDLIKKGWSIIKCKNLTDIELISKNFINELKKNITLTSILKKQNIKEVFCHCCGKRGLPFLRDDYLSDINQNRKFIIGFSIAPAFNPYTDIISDNLYKVR